MSSAQFQTALKSDTIAERATAQYLAEGSKQLLDGKVPKQLLDDRGQTIRDRDAIRRRQTETILSRFLVLFLCSWSENGVQTGIDLSRSPLTHYLRRQSQWMDEMLGSSNELLWDAPDLPLPIGGEAKLLTQAEAQRLLSELQKVSPPSQDSNLASQYAALQQLLEIAAQEPRFRLLLRTT